MEDLERWADLMRDRPGLIRFLTIVEKAVELVESFALAHDRAVVMLERG